MQERTFKGPDLLLPGGPLMIGLGLGRGNGGPYKTLLQFREALKGVVVSVSDKSTKKIDGDGIVHLQCGDSWIAQKALWLPPEKRSKLVELIKESSHLQCHILFRHHAHLVWKYGQRYRRPYWVIRHGCLDRYVVTYRRAIKLAWMQAFGRMFWSDAEHVIFSSNRERGKARVWMSRDNGRVVRWPVQLPAERRNEADQLALKKRLGIAGNARVLLWLGRLHPMKRPIESAKLFADVCDASRHLVFIASDEN